MASLHFNRTLASWRLTVYPVMLCHIARFGIDLTPNKYSTSITNTNTVRIRFNTIAVSQWIWAFNCFWKIKYQSHCTNINQYQHQHWHRYDQSLEQYTHHYYPVIFKVLEENFLHRMLNIAQVATVSVNLGANSKSNCNAQRSNQSVIILYFQICINLDKVIQGIWQPYLQPLKLLK